MRKKYLKVLSLSLLLSTFAFTGCGKEIKITFNGDNGAIVRKIQKGETLGKDKIPQTPYVKGKYCLWDEVDFATLTEDTTVNYTCYDSVASLEGNIKTTIDVDISSDEAKIENILNNVRLVATLEGGEKRYLYKGDYTIDLNGYNKDVSGTYRVELGYNNKKLPITINVNKIKGYVTAYLGSSMGYLNEGLPNIYANTEVEGTIKFDDNQTLSIGTVAYNWTFVPENKNMYEVVHGKSEVKIIDASEITTNKDSSSLTFDYYTSKADIIAAIKDELVVRGKFDNIYREIGEQYYTIDSDYKVDQPGDNILFTVSYGSRVEPAKIYVNVKKNSHYAFEVDDVENYVKTSQSTLDDLLPQVRASINTEAQGGTFTFDEGQILRAGNYKYKYTYTPNNKYWEVKTGEISINAIQVSDILVDKDHAPQYQYGEKTKEEIAADLKKTFEGNFVYSDGSIGEIDNDALSIHIPSYNPEKPGEYAYVVSYDGVSVEHKFNLVKRKLKESSDFYVDIVPESMNFDNPEIYPEFILVDANDSFDESKFMVVPDLTVGFKDFSGNYIYGVKIVPIDDLADKYEVVSAVASYIEIY